MTAPQISARRPMGSGASHRGASAGALLSMIPAACGMAFCGIILWATLGNMLFPHYGLSRYPMGWTLAVSALVAVLMGGLYLTLRKAGPFLLQYRTEVGLAAASGWVALFTLHVRLAYAVRLQEAGAGSDPVFSSAVELAAGTRTEMAVALLNAALLFAGIAMTYAAGRMLGGRAVGVVTLVPSTVLVLLSPWLGVLSPDTAGLLFPLLILCLLLAGGRVRRTAVRVLLWGLAGAVGALGAAIAPAVLLCMAAAGITAACSPVLRGRGRGAATVLVAAAVVAAGFFASAMMITAFEQRTSAIGFDVGENPAAVPPAHHVQVSAESVSMMGVGGYASFLNDRLLEITGDGSFASPGELSGPDGGFASVDPADRGIQEAFGRTRPGFPWLLSLWQGTWFAVLALVTAPLFLRTARMLLPEVTGMRVALLGLLAVLLLSDGNARLLYPYAPFFILLAALSLQALADRVLPARHPGSGRRRKMIE